MIVYMKYMYINSYMYVYMIFTQFFYNYRSKDPHNQVIFRKIMEEILLQKENQYSKLIVESEFCKVFLVCILKSCDMTSSSIIIKVIIIATFVLQKLHRAILNRASACGGRQLLQNRLKEYKYNQNSEEKDHAKHE